MCKIIGMLIGLTLFILGDFVEDGYLFSWIFKGGESIGTLFFMIILLSIGLLIGNICDLEK